jgi:hypothetical protein
MFATADHFRRTDRPLYSAATLIRALSQGKTPEQARAVGASIAPWQIISDPIVYMDSGAKRASHRFLAIAIAACIAGEKDLLDGMSSRDDFFEDLPLNETRETLVHANTPLAVACAYEALGRGRMDILGMLKEKAREAKEKYSSKDADRSWHVHRFDSLLHSAERDSKVYFHYLSHSPSLSPQQLLDGFSWVAGLSERHSAADLASQWLTVACESGNSAAVNAALFVGALPTWSHVRSAAQRGALDAASLMAPLADAFEKATPKTTTSALRALGRAPKAGAAPARESIVEDMVQSYARSLQSIGDGATEWRAPSDTGREMTWAEYSDNRDAIHQACLMAMAGSFDSSLDDPSRLDKAKTSLASLARALCSLGQAGDALRLDQIETARPAAPPLAEELLLLGRIGSARLGPMLDQASPTEGSRFAPMLLKAHANAAIQTRRAQGWKDSPARSALLDANGARLGAALFASYERESSLFDAPARQQLRDYLVQAGLAVEFERQSLELASTVATKRSRPLKV